jgi:hypothetical protein
MAGGQAHAYQLTLTSGQYLLVVVEQRGKEIKGEGLVGLTRGFM